MHFCRQIHQSATINFKTRTKIKTMIIRSSKLTWWSHFERKGENPDENSWTNWKRFICSQNSVFSQLGKWCLRFFPEFPASFVCLRQRVVPPGGGVVCGIVLLLFIINNRINLSAVSTPAIKGLLQPIKRALPAPAPPAARIIFGQITQVTHRTFLRVWVRWLIGGLSSNTPPKHGGSDVAVFLTFGAFTLVSFDVKYQVLIRGRPYIT